MRIVTVLGSPRPGGNTATALGWIEDKLKAGGHALERINVIDYNMSGCTGCNTCKLEPLEPGCIIDDDVDMLLKKLIDADLTLLATPLFCWGFTSQLKTLIDRCYSLKKPGEDGATSLIAGKKLALLVTSAGPFEGNAEALDMPFDRICWFTQTVPAGKLFLTGCTSPEEMDEDMKAQALAFAQEITG
ncbi:flavodoxin family protein [bacterium]|nr:flavodoxin family protein [bacterium]